MQLAKNKMYMEEILNIIKLRIMQQFTNFIKGSEEIICQYFTPFLQFYIIGERLVDQ